MFFIQVAISQIDWFPYAMSALGVLGWAAFLDLKGRVKTLEDDKKKEDEARTLRNEKIAERISEIERDSIEQMGKIREQLARIIK